MHERLHLFDERINLVARGRDAASVYAVLRRPQLGYQSIALATVQCSLLNRSVHIGDERLGLLLRRRLVRRRGLGGTDVHFAIAGSRNPIQLGGASHRVLHNSGANTWRIARQMEITVRQVKKLRVLDDVPNTTRIRRGAAVVEDASAGIGPV